MSRQEHSKAKSDPNPERTKADFAKAHFKAKGPGWQSRIDDALRKIAKITAC